jgi:serine/threonine protein kinase
VRPDGDASGDERRVAEALDRYVEALRAGEAPDRADFLAGHADLAEALDEALRGLDFVAGPGAPSEPGERMLGDFRLLREVGRGGMGVVYEARQVSLGRRVALKVLPFASILDPRTLQRFRNEAQAAASLHHTHIVPVYAVGAERGVHYYAMQFVEGESLAGAIRDLRSGARRGGKTPISSHGSHREPAFVRTAARLAMQAAGALDHAHQVGIVHRDVKPGNLLVDGAGELWVTDFGLARLPTDASLTRTGDLVGTVRYMSPEQAAGPAAAVDHRSDVYSLGVTFYELLTLEPAARGDDAAAVLRDIAKEELP